MEIRINLVSVVSYVEPQCQYGYATVSPPSGYLSSQAASEHGPGTPNCPWLIKAQPGQKINVTLLDFSLLSLVSMIT